MNQSQTTRTRRRGFLSCRVGKIGKESKIACGACRRDHAKCVVSSASSFCCQCIKKGHRCDLHLSESEWKKMELEREQLEAQLRETDDQLSKLLPRQIRLRRQLGRLSQKEADAICRELSAIKDQKSLDAQEQEALRIIHEQEARQAAAPLSFEDVFSSEALASLELLSPSDLVAADLLGGNPPVSGSSQS